MINVENPPSGISVGRETENSWRSITVQCAEWLARYPAATVTALWLPQGADDPYPVFLTADGTLRTWQPQSAELVEGTGRLQFFLLAEGGDVIGSSAVIECEVGASLTSPTEHPADEAPPWTLQVVEDVEETVNEALEGGIAQAIADYLEEHPITVTESDPTVPAWAKAAQKPSYTAAEVGAVPTTRTVNGKALSADITLDASDVGAGTYSKPSGGIPASDLASAVQTSLGKADTALQAAPVTSVNGQTGAVTVTVPTKTSDLTNDSGFLTAHQDISGKVNVAQGVANAGKFLVVGSDGNVAPVTMTAWQGGSY